MSEQTPMEALQMEIERGEGTTTPVVFLKDGGMMADGVLYKPSPLPSINDFDRLDKQSDGVQRHHAIDAKATHAMRLAEGMLVARLIEPLIDTDVNVGDKVDLYNYVTRHYSTYTVVQIIRQLPNGYDVIVSDNEAKTRNSRPETINVGQPTLLEVLHKVKPKTTMYITPHDEGEHYVGGELQFIYEGENGAYASFWQSTTTRLGDGGEYLDAEIERETMFRIDVKNIGGVADGEYHDVDLITPDENTPTSFINAANKIRLTLDKWGKLDLTKDQLDEVFFE